MSSILGPRRYCRLSLFNDAVRPQIYGAVRLRRSPCLVRYRIPACTQVRGAKSVSRQKVKELEQGIISAEPLPAEEPENVVQYPSVLQGVKNNMIKFENCVVITKVGNFYELYFEHAEEYGPHLGLKVSSRQTNAGPVAMAGFPIWQLDRFLKILVQDLNKHVAISEEFPTSPSGKVKSGGLLFDRRVARIVTPGTLIDEKFLDPYQNNFLLSIHIATPDMSNVPSSQETVGLAWLDLSTGDFFTQITSFSLLPSILLRISAREVLLSSSLSQTLVDKIIAILRPAHDVITFHSSETPFHTMKDWDTVLESPVANDAEEMFTATEKMAGHQLLEYVCLNLQGSQLQLRPPQRREMRETLIIDRSSLKGLEILETSRDGFGKGSLFHAVRRTVTKSGARLLRDRLTSPSASLPEINARLDLVNRFYKAKGLQEQLNFHLRRTHDVQRLVQKFAVNKGDADDMLCLAKAISETSSAHEVLLKSEQAVPPALKADYSGLTPNPIMTLLNKMSLQGPMELCDQICEAIDEEGLNEKHRLEDIEDAEVAALARDVAMSSGSEELDALPKAVRSKTKMRDQESEVKEAWIMRRQASETLSRLHAELDDMRRQKEELATHLSTDLSAPSLTLKWTPGLGHICHIKSATGFNRLALEALNARMVSSSKSTRSFYLSSWTHLGNSMDKTRTQIRNEEQRIFERLRHVVIQNLVHLRRNARIMDELDVSNAFATLAQEQGWTRPILNGGQAHKVVGGRHPTVKLGLEERGRSFVSNDLSLDEQRIWIITGPNMAGKSTFLRQNALITILAQVGSYVPADYAELGLVDQVFSRIGAADDLYRDQSTFMVEMLETAAILKYATSRSFVIMDEVGRGTTPEDGTSVAFASLHHLYHETKCRTLFATHFHALHEMTKGWDNLGRFCTDIHEDEATGSFSFVHKLRPGVNRESHALKVAKMAGLPQSAIEIAKETFDSLVSRDHDH